MYVRSLSRKIATVLAAVVALLTSDVAGQGVEKQLLDRRAPADLRANPAGLLPIQQPSVVTPAPEVVRLWTPEVASKVQLSSTLLSTIADLGSPDFALRQSASAKLADQAVTAEELFALLVRGRLSDEQVERVLAAAHSKVMAMPRGALGIRMQPSGDHAHPGIEVTMLLPKLPAEKVLRIGDRIEKIDGKPVTDSNDLVEIIQSKLPGETVRLYVARPLRDDRGKQVLNDNREVVEENLTIDIPLASATELDQVAERQALPSRSIVMERRQKALNEANARFSPKPVGAVVAPVADSDSKAAPKPPITPE